MKPMSFAARVRDAEWKLKHGYSVLSPGRRIGRTIAGKIVLPSASASQPPALPGDDNGAAAASKLPASASPSDAGHSPAGSSRCDDRTAQRAVPTNEGSANLA